jgi:uncharacterized protein (TIGR03086 family)
MEQFELHAGAAEEFGKRVAHIRDDQWTDPTPCADWDVHELVRHVVYGNLWAPPLVEGFTIEQVGDRFEGAILGDDPKAALERSAAGAVAAFNEPGAMERTVHISMGPTPCSEYCAQRTEDLLIHAWDLARGIGANDDLPEELLRPVHERIVKYADMYRQFGALGPKVEPPPDADFQTLVLAVYGRVR